MKILIIEDERNLSDSIVAYLSGEKYQCEQAFTYEDAKEKVNLYEYDCVLLDLMLPGGNGLGLSIVKAVCDYHDWKVSYSYADGKHQFTVQFL